MALKVQLQNKIEFTGIELLQQTNIKLDYNFDKREFKNFA